MADGAAWEPQGVMLDREEILRRRKRYWPVRRMQDVVLSLFALAVLWPVMAVIAAVILLDCPGGSPVFSQERIGRDGKPFRIYKFRTMIPGAERRLEGLLPCNEMNGPAFKMREDPRITQVGRFLRKTSLDELPQLINVLRGEMSIVGPRPPLPREAAQYSAYQRQRLYVTPGLTCYWQIQPDRNSIPFDSWVELDLRYIRDAGFTIDWMIIWKTFGVILKMQGV